MKSIGFSVELIGKSVFNVAGFVAIKEKPVITDRQIRVMIGFIERLKPEKCFQSPQSYHQLKNLLT